MAEFATTDDFVDLIAQEVYVDVERLRFLSFHGIPDDVRAPVWHLLLNSHAPRPLPSPSSSSSSSSASAHIDPDFSKLIRDAIDAYCPKQDLFRRQAVRERMEKTLMQYHVRHADSFARRNPKLLVCLFGPFVLTFGGKQRVECEQSWFKFMQVLELHNEPQVKQRHFSRFMALFRTHLPRLRARFEEEEMEPRRWVADLHRGLFATQLASNLDCLLRLWDAYLSALDSNNGGGGFELHIYVCLAVLKLYEGLLLDMNYAEIRGFLDRIELDARDVPKVLAQADNFRGMVD